MLEARPGAVVPLAGEGPAAARTAVRGRAHGSNVRRGAVVGTDATVGREQRLDRGDDRRHGRGAAPPARPAAARGPRDRPTRRSARGAGVELRRRSARPHARGGPPDRQEDAQPSARAASAALGSSGAEEEHRAARPRAGRLAAERAGLAHRVPQPSHRRRAHARVQGLLVPPVERQQRADRARGRRPGGLAIRSATSRSAVQRAGRPRVRRARRPRMTRPMVVPEKRDAPV